MRPDENAGAKGKCSGLGNASLSIILADLGKIELAFLV
jgi:hypothetical protein